MRDKQQEKPTHPRRYLAPDVFSSDHERRTLGFIAPTRDTVEDLALAMGADPYTVDENGDPWPVSVGDVRAVLKDLESRGLAKVKDDRWEVTPGGALALHG